MWTDNPHSGITKEEGSSMKWKNMSEIGQEKPGEMLIVLGLYGHDNDGTNKLALAYLPDNKTSPIIYAYSGRKSNYRPIRYIRIDEIER